MPTVTFSNGNMFVRGKNPSADSAFKLSEYDARPWDLEILKRRFNVDITALQNSLFAAGFVA